MNKSNHNQPTANRPHAHQTFEPPYNQERTTDPHTHLVINIYITVKQLKLNFDSEYTESLRFQ